MMGRLSRGVLACSALAVALYSAGPVHAQATPSPVDEILTLVNEQRTAAGLRPLRLHPQLQRAAQGYADTMAQTNTFGHTGRDGSTPFSRMAAAGYRGTMMGENIARGFTSPSSVMDAWMNSAGHRANILNPGYTDLGVGVAQGSSGMYWVQDFGASDYEDLTPVAQPLPPSISQVSPNAVRIGDPVTISGQRFGTTPGTVTFTGGQTGQLSSWTDNDIVAVVPYGASTGPLYVQNQAGTSAGAYLYVLSPAGLTPFLQNISPSSGAPGTLVTIYGQRLGATPGSVTFNGVPAVVLYWSASGFYVQALVPQGAGNGPIVVTRADGQATNGMNFTVPGTTAQPSSPSQPVPFTPAPSPGTTQPPATPTGPPAPVVTPPSQPTPTYPYSRFRYRYRYTP